MYRFTQRRTNASSSRTFAVAIAVLCLALLALLLFVQVAHVHATTTDADHCQLCIVLHAVAPVALIVAAIILIRLGSPAPTSEPEFAIRTWIPTLFTRPPPVGC